MPAITASAPGKIILFGEHAVVYGYPAIAVPVTQVRARVVVRADPRATPGRVHIEAPAVNLNAYLEELPGEHPIAAAIQAVLDHLQLRYLPACHLRITSTIPVASGLGSGAAVSAALVRALATFLGHPLQDSEVNDLVYVIEKIHHGTPSGIDNTVVTYGQPVYFVRGKPIEKLRVAAPFNLVIGDTGIASSTGVTVGAVRKAWQAAPEQYEALFEAIGEIAFQARRCIESGEVAKLGPLLNANHEKLQQMGVSSPELDQLVIAARKAGADGAKLSGGGGGGNMVALVTPNLLDAVTQALHAAGAVRVIATSVPS